jgi:hypothetical protein
VSADKEFQYRIAYDEAVRAPSQQQNTIESLRTRAGLLLSSAAITTSFLGAQALNEGGPAIPTWIAGVLLTLEVVLWLIDLAART